MRFARQTLLDGLGQTLARLSARARGEQPDEEPHEIVQPSAPREPGSDWDLVSETLDHSATHGEAALRLHEAAILEIEAAEYAYQRMIDECPGLYVREAVQRLRAARAAMEGGEVAAPDAAASDEIAA